MSEPEPHERHAPEPPAAAGDDEAGGVLEGAPPVVAVVVTRDATDAFDATLQALAAQEYPDLTVLVVDAGSRVDPTPRVAAVLPQAFVRRLEGDPGFAAAADEVLAAVEGATFLLFCHDDVAPDPSALRVMVEEAYRSNAAIVGPKLVDAANPDVLLEVGRAIDHFGVPHTGIEPGELDQEQHDGVRDVFYTSGAAMLVRADLFAELGGFDPEASPGAEDLDLCWRARLAGARVIVAPDARVLRPVAPGPPAAVDAKAASRRRVRAVCTNASGFTLVWVLPAGIVVSLVEALAFSLTRRRGRAFAELGAWWHVLVHPGRIRAARRRAQALRTVHDRDLRELQVGPGARLSAFLTQHHADERMHSIGDAGRSALASVAEAVTHGATVGALAVLALFLIGSRELIHSGVPAIGTMARWPAVGDLLDSFASAWRYTGLGSTAPAPPLLALMAGVGGVLLGAVGLARTLVVVGAFVLGAVGAYRLARRLSVSYGAAVATGVLYGINPVPRNAVAQGELGPLVLFALLPFLVSLLGRAAGFDRARGTRVAGRPLVGLTLLVAVATAWYPPAIFVVPCVALVLLVAAPFVGGLRAAAQAVLVSLVATAGALVLLAPWPLILAHLRDDLAAVGLAPRPVLSFDDALSFHTGPAGGGVAGWGFLVAATFAVLVGSGPRFAWAGRAWLLAAAGFAGAYVPGRIDPDAAVPAPEAALALAALGLALAAGLGVEAFRVDLPRARFGWRQVLVGAGVAGFVVALAGFAASSVDGRWDAPDGDWASQLAWTGDLAREGGFRILWVGAQEAVPMQPVEVGDDLVYSLTRDGPGDARELLRGPVRTADRRVGAALELAVGGRTSRLGRLLGPTGVRFVALARRAAPGAPDVGAPDGVDAALAAQLDLARLRTDAGLVLYENQAWVPTRALVRGGAAGRVLAEPGRVRPALRTDVPASARPLGDEPAGPGTVLWSEAYDDGWSAHAGGETLSHTSGFGYLNAWRLPTRGVVGIDDDDQWKRYPLLAGEAVLWLLALGVWWRGRRRARRLTPATATPATRAERRRGRPAPSERVDDLWGDG